MSHFTGTHRAKLDKKGRVSFPAQYRTIFGQIGNNEVYLRRHHRNASIEGFPRSRLDKMAADLAPLNDYSEESEDARLALFADSTLVTYDSEGRFSMPQEHAEYAQLGETIVFAGLGEFFLIMDDAAYQRRIEEARQRNRPGLNLPPAPRPPA
jgi:MraZ protein